LPVVLHWCETHYLPLREGRRLKVFENRVPRSIFAPKNDEIIGDWGKLEGPHNLYTSPNIISIIRSRRMRWTGNIARMERIGSIRDFGG
jgi:hypothetical protein